MEIRWVIRGVIVAVVIGVVLVVAFASTTDEEVDPADLEPLVAEIVTADELAEIASDSDFPIYWAGEIEGRDIDLILYEDLALVTYLDPEEGVEGAASATAVGTYVTEDPEAETAAVAEGENGVELESEGGRTVAVAGDTPTSVYFAVADDGVQVEVYDPDSRRALRLALSESVVPVE